MTGTTPTGTLGLYGIPIKWKQSLLSVKAVLNVSGLCQLIHDITINICVHIHRVDTEMDKNCTMSAYLVGSMTPVEPGTVFEQTYNG